MNYSILHNLFGAYLNQDYDLICESDTIEGALDYYVAESPSETLKALSDEIEDFCLKNSDKLDESFSVTFQPEVDIGNTREFFSLLIDKARASGKLA